MLCAGGLLVCFPTQLALLDGVCAPFERAGEVAGGL